LSLNIGDHIPPALLHKPPHGEKQNASADEKDAFIEKGEKPIEIFNNNKKEQEKRA